MNNRDDHFLFQTRIYYIYILHNETHFLYLPLPTCNGCGKKLYSAVDECCGKGRSDIEQEEEEEEEEEVYEIEINGKKYYTNDITKKNGDVFAITSDDDIGGIVGKFKNGKFVLLKTTRTM